MTPTPIALPILNLETAKILAHRLARVDKAPAYVVLHEGHPHLASAWCVGPDKPWPMSSVVFTAPAPE